MMRTLLAVIVTIGALLALPATADTKGTLFVNLTTDESHRADMAIAFSKGMMERGHPVVVWLNDKGVLIAAQEHAGNFAAQQETLAALMNVTAAQNDLDDPAIGALALHLAGSRVDAEMVALAAEEVGAEPAGQEDVLEAAVAVLDVEAVHLLDVAADGEADIHGDHVAHLLRRCRGEALLETELVGLGLEARHVFRRVGLEPEKVPGLQPLRHPGRQRMAGEHQHVVEEAANLARGRPPAHLLDVPRLGHHPAVDVRPDLHRHGVVVAALAAVAGAGAAVEGPVGEVDAGEAAFAAGIGLEPVGANQRRRATTDLVPGRFALGEQEGEEGRGLDLPVDARCP
jgi:hypothetical protein